MRTKWDFLLISTTTGAEAFPWRTASQQAQLPVLRCCSSSKCSSTFHLCHSPGSELSSQIWCSWGLIHLLTDLRTEAKASSWMLAKAGARLGSSQQPQESGQPGSQPETALASGNYSVPAWSRQKSWPCACKDYQQKRIFKKVLYFKLLNLITH